MTPLKFPDRKIVEIPDDRLAHATGAIHDAVADFQFVAAELFNYRDVTGLLQLRADVRGLIESLETVTDMALDFASRVGGA